MYAVLVIANKKVTHIVGMENVLYQLLFSTVTVAIFLLFREGLFFRFRQTLGDSYFCLAL